MADANLKALKDRAIEIRDEKDPGDNTANRVGSLFYDIINFFNSRNSSNGGNTGVGGITDLGEPLTSIANQLNGNPTRGYQIICYYENAWHYVDLPSGDVDPGMLTFITDIQNDDGTLEITRDGQTVYINSNTWTFNEQGHLIYEGTVDVTELTAGNITATRIDTNDLFAQDAVIENLTVTKAAHFFKLMIDEIKSSQGQVIITPANAVIDKVDPLSNGYYRCYFKATDGEKKIYNMFETDDQVICQTFNAATGVSYDVSNKFYWRKVVGVSNEPVNVLIDGENFECHYIDVSDSDKDQYSNSIPEAGDNIVQLGNRTDSTRQAAIIISAYNNTYLDAGIDSPSIVQYDGINDYTLSTHRLNVISKSLNQFKGQFSTGTGDDIEDLITAIGEGTTMYLHTAYANSADGQTDFSKTYFEGAVYVGMCSNFTQSDTSLVYSDYQWMRIKGDDGDAGFTYKLIPVREKAIVSAQDVLGIGFSYQLIKVEGSVPTPINPSTSTFTMRFKSDLSTNTTSLNSDSTKFYYTNANWKTSYHEQTSCETYFTIELVQNSNVVDTRIVNVAFDAGATLTVADNITASVQNFFGGYSNITQAAEEIQSSVYSDVLQDIKIGGRNLLRNTITYREDSKLEHASQDKDGYVERTNMTTTVNLIAGHTYILQCKSDGLLADTHYGSSGADPTRKYFTVWLRKDNVSEVFTSVNVTEVITFSGYKLYYWKFTASSTGEYHFRTNTYSNGATRVIVNFWDIKLEEGNIRTDWTPAPEDINSTYSTITQTSNLIEAKVTEKIAGLKQTFPVKKPWLKENGIPSTEYLENPIRYMGGKLDEEYNYFKIFSTPTFVKEGEYELFFYMSVNINSSSFTRGVIASFGNTYPSSLSGTIQYINASISLYSGASNIKTANNTWLYPYKATINIPTGGYYSFSWFDLEFENFNTDTGEYIYIPESNSEYESNYSRIKVTTDQIQNTVNSQGTQISTITQRADSIENTVNDVNTRLDDGGFTINANTTINGQLAITSSSEQGFIVTGDNGNTSILSESIGTYNNFKNNATKWILVNGYVNHASWTPSSNSYSTSSNISLGSISSGTVLKFKLFSCSAHKSNSGDNYIVDSFTGKIEIYNGSSVVNTFNNITSASGELSYTVASTGTYSLKLYWTISSLLSSSGQSVSSATIDTAFAMYAFIPNGTYTLIGYDGIASNFGNDNTVFFGKDGTYIRYTDNNVLRVSSNGIEKYAGSTNTVARTGGYATDTCLSQFVQEYAPINGVAVRKVTSLNSSTSALYLKPNDEMIILELTSGDHSKRLNVFLGEPSSNIGRRVYFKKSNEHGEWHLYGANTTSSATNKIKGADGSIVTEAFSGINDYKSIMYISDGTYWIEFYCG